MLLASNIITDMTQFGKVLSPEIFGSTQSFVRNMLKGDGSASKYIPPRKCEKAPFHQSRY